MIKYLFIFSLILFSQDHEIMILGTAQDAGFPHLNCNKEHCKNQYSKKQKEPVSSIAIIDKTNNKFVLLDASPDLPQQCRMVSEYIGKEDHFPEAIFLTHAHIGHYTGLMYLGRESANAKNVEVYCGPRMKQFLSSNGPWDQLLKINNIDLKDINENLFKITPLLVPHRDEYSETYGFIIDLGDTKALYLPDIDKWSRWDIDIRELIKEVDYAFIDGTFYKNEEIPGRDMSEIPHPFIEESIELFQDLSNEEKDKIYFIHLNHTNPLLWDDEAIKELESKGFHVAKTGMVF